MTDDACEVAGHCLLIQLRDQLEEAEARLAEVEAERDQALELAEEVIPYAGEYFDEKWALTERLNELKVRAAARGGAVADICSAGGQDTPGPARPAAGSLERHMEWLYGENGCYGNKGPCTCSHAWGNLGTLYRVNMGKGWVRTNTDPDCPNHGRVSR